MIKVSFPNGHDVYDHSIKSFVMQAFSSKLCVDKCDIVDLLTTELFASKQVRLGPKPSVESQVAIRDVIRHYVSNDQPIPFMVPWGSEKPDGSSIDIAELMGLKTFIALHSRVTAHYKPGVQLNIRLEDASAPHLFSDRAAQAWAEADRYSTAFANLVSILGVESFITVKRESYVVSVDEFNAEADKYVEAMFDYLACIFDGRDDTQAFDKVKSFGWSGRVPLDLMEYYLYSYTKLYPSMHIMAKVRTLSRYFSGALARTKLGIRGDEKSWDGKFIDLSFVQNPPGTDNRFNRRIIYRTIPSEFSSSHIPPWRAKGYLAINEEGNACPKLISYSDERMSTLNSRTITLNKNNVAVDIKADFITV